MRNGLWEVALVAACRYGSGVRFSNLWALRSESKELPCKEELDAFHNL